MRYFKELSITIPSIFAQWAYDNSGLLTVVDLTGTTENISPTGFMYTVFGRRVVLLSPLKTTHEHPHVLKLKQSSLKKLKVLNTLSFQK